LPVISELPASVTIMIFSYCFDSSITAIAAADVGRSMIMSTPSSPYHLRAIKAALSALFSASAVTSSIGLPNIEPPKSAIAILVASTLPIPPMSE
jgi:hypothetical protein